MRSLFLSLLFLTAASGCDAVFPDPSYAGVVVDAETGAPLEGIHVSFQTNGSFGQYSVVAKDLKRNARSIRNRNPNSRRAPKIANSPRGVFGPPPPTLNTAYGGGLVSGFDDRHNILSHIHISEPTRQY